MKYIVSLAFILAACAPLNPTSTPLQKTGEAVGRTILCPLTLCFSEVGFYQNYQAEQKREAYEQWRVTLTPEEQDREDRRQAEAARSLAIGLAVQPRIISAHPVYTAPTVTTRNCVSNAVGTYLYTNCN